MTTKYIPLGWRILVEVEPYQNEELALYERVKKESNIIIDDKKIKDLRERAQSGSEIGIVKAIGEYAWRLQFETDPWFKVGDKILFVQYAGREFKHKDYPDKSFRIINDQDPIALVIED